MSNSESAKSRKRKQSEFMRKFNLALKQMDGDAEGQKRKQKKYTCSQMVMDAARVVQLYVHVLICALLVLLSVRYLSYYRVALQDFSLKDFLPHDKLVTVLQQQPQLREQALIAGEGESKLESPWVILSIVAFLLVFLISGTFLLLLLYKRGYSHSIKCISAGPYLLYLAIFPLVYLQELIYTLNLAVDWPTVLLFLYNQTLTGFWVLFYSGPKWAKRIFYVIISSMLALFLVKFINQWIEIGLMLTLIVWDLYAVLHSKGPLNQLLTTLQNTKGGDLPPVVFQMSLSQPDNNNNQVAQAAKAKRHKIFSLSSAAPLGERFELGLGDFIFYSILVSKSFTYAGPLGATCTVLCLLIGLTLTVAVLILFGQAIPAIPIPVTLGLIAQLATSYLFIPFSIELNSEMIVL